ncbi:MAG TPA: MaoC family dehydratase [Pseudomonadales bacterium]|nr:MaoC family dehydratase [Pseudomonadales bacterium]
MKKTIQNIPFADITVGLQRQYSKTLTERDLQLFAETSGDYNPVHLDSEYAATTAFGERIAHGMWSGALISAAIATTLPGPGTVYRSQTLKFSKPVKLGDVITITLTVIDKKDRVKLVTIECEGRNQRDEIVVKGEAEVIASGDSLLFTIDPQLAVQ